MTSHETDLEDGSNPYADTAETKGSDFYTDPKHADIVDDMCYRFFEEGLNSFVDRSDWAEVEDPEFQRLLQAYLSSVENLTNHMKKKFNYE